MKSSIYLGIDGGGTHTRIAAVDREGRLLAYVEKGPSCLTKDLQATENVRQAIAEAIAKTGRNLNDVAGLSAGIAGYDEESDLDWVQELTRVKGLTCPRFHVNDCMVAHIGAFLFRPGIIAISGTGAKIFGITEEALELDNYHLQHYTWSTARHLSYSAVQKILAEETDDSDVQLISRILAFLNLKDIRSLREYAFDHFAGDSLARDKLFGDMCPIVTQAAQEGSRVAASVCDTAVRHLNTGIRLIGSFFSSQTVPVAFVGSVLNSAYIKSSLERELRRSVGTKQYPVFEMALPAVLGAVVLAMQSTGVPISEDLIGKLRECAAMEIASKCKPAES